MFKGLCVGSMLVLSNGTYLETREGRERDKIHAQERT